MRYNTNEHKEKRFRIIRNCMLISGLSVFAQLYLFQPMLSELQASFGVSLATGSLAVSASTIGMATGLFLFAFKADTFKRERLMSLSLILSALLTITSAFMSHFVLLLLLNFLKGIALSGVSAVALAYLSDEIEPGKIGLAISLYLSGNTIGGMTGRVAGSLLAGWGGWQQAVWVIGITSLLLGFLFYWKIPTSSQVSQNSISIREKLQQMRDLLSKRLFIGMYLIGSAQQTVVHWNVSHRRTGHGRIRQCLQLHLHPIGVATLWPATPDDSHDFCHVSHGCSRIDHRRQAFGQA